MSRSEPSSVLRSLAVVERTRSVARVQLLDHVGREQLDVLVGLGPVEHDRRGAELVAAVHDLHLGGELAEEDRLLHGRVAAADDQRRLVAEEGGVARGAIGDATAAELLLARDPELAVLGAHRKDHRAGPILVVAHVDLVHAAGLVGELDPRGLVGQEPRAEALGLVAELLHELRAHDPLGEAWVVLHVGGLLEQPAPEEPLDDEGLEVGARCVERCRVPGGAGSDDDDVLDAIAHFIFYSTSVSSVFHRATVRRNWR